MTVWNRALMVLRFDPTFVDASGRAEEGSSQFSVHALSWPGFRITLPEQLDHRKNR